MVWGLVKKASHFLGDVHHKVKHGIQMAKQGLSSVKGFGSKAVSFLNNLGPVGQAVAQVGQSAVNMPIEALGGRSVRGLLGQVESGLGTAERVVGGDKRAIADLVKSGAMRYGGGAGRRFAGMIR